VNVVRTRRPGDPGAPDRQTDSGSASDQGEAREAAWRRSARAGRPGAARRRRSRAARGHRCRPRGCARPRGRRVCRAVGRVAEPVS